MFINIFSFLFINNDKPPKGKIYRLNLEKKIKQKNKTKQETVKELAYIHKHLVSAKNKKTKVAKSVAAP